MNPTGPVRYVKRAIDVAGSLVLLVLTSPLLAGIAIAIVVLEGRPVLFVQRRVGLEGAPFRMFKFRTMVNDAVRIGREMAIGGGDPFGVVKNDPRITRTGRWLRRTSLDELPQLVNVFRGEMSLVGPRPDLVEQAANYSPTDRRRLAVRPGITGYSQVHGRDEISWPERIAQDLWYIENWSLRMDLRIVLDTFGQFARAEPDPIIDVMNIERADLTRSATVPVGDVLSGSEPASNQPLEVPAHDWDRVLGAIGLDDLYLSRSYLRLAATIEPGDPVLLHQRGAGGDVVLPMLIRAIPDSDLFDAVTPYGYGGPVAAGGEPPLSAFHASWDGWCRQRRIVSTFVRFHPLYANHELPLPATMGLRRLSGTVAWRLDDGDLMARMHGKHRNAVRKAQRLGVRVTIDAGADTLDSFIPIYEQTMRRAGASASYLFSAAHWQTMRTELADRMIIANAWHGDDLVASALCFRSDPWLHYHLGASTDAGRDLGATTSALFDLAQWAQAAGLRRLHLGGGRGGSEDSLLTFKRRFDPRAGLCDAAVGSIVHDGTSYRRLSGNAEHSDYFPAYRDPSAGKPLSDTHPS